VISILPSATSRLATERVAGISPCDPLGNAFLATSEGQQDAPGFLEFSIDNILNSSFAITPSSATAVSAFVVASAFDVVLDLFFLVASLLLLAIETSKVFLRFIVKCYQIKIEPRIHQYLSIVFLNFLLPLKYAS
jgi:hypothetical protein